MIEIKRHGSFLDTDQGGVVISELNEDLVQSEWQPIIDETVSFYKNNCGDNLICVYIRGSVAKGEAVKDISDLDSFCIVKETVELEDKIEDYFVTKMMGKFPFCTHVEIGFVKKSNVFDGFPPRKRGIWDELIKTQSICVYGDDISSELKSFELEDMIGHSYNLEGELDKLPAYFEEDKNEPDEIKGLCVWIARRVIRSGFDLVMLKEKKFTRDLYLCYESFSKYYPGKEIEMKSILDLALNPIDDVELINKNLELICPWMITKIREELI